MKSARPTAYVTISRACSDELSPHRNGDPWGFWGALEGAGLQRPMRDACLLLPNSAAPHSHFNDGGERNGRRILRIDPPRKLRVSRYVLWLDRGLFAGASPEHIGLSVDGDVQYCQRFFATELPVGAERGSVSEVLSRGILYRYEQANGQHPGGDPPIFVVENTGGAEDGNGVRPGEPVGELVGLLNPLILWFSTDAGFPERFPEQAREFCRKYREPKHLVDVIPVFPPEAWGRCLLHQHLAARHRELQAVHGERPPLARLLFHSRWPVAPLPFLVLDGFGGTFRFSGLADSRPTKAWWHRSAGDGDAEHAAWLRDWSVAQLDIEEMDGPATMAAIPPVRSDTSPYYEVHTPGTRGRLDEGFFGHAETYPVLRWWRGCLRSVPGATDAEGDPYASVRTEEEAVLRLAQRAFAHGDYWYPETFIRILGEERLLPRSTILVDLPGPPGEELPCETAKTWREFVAGHAIDLARTPRRPAVWWLELHFEALLGSPVRAEEAWDVYGDRWWYAFYRSLFLLPESYVPTWTHLGAVLDSFFLDQHCLDGGPSGATDIRGFALA